MSILSEVYQLTTDLFMHMPLACVRLLYAKLTFKKIGKDCYFGRCVHIICPHKISIGNNVVINRNCTLDGRKGVEIQDNVDIGEFSSIWSLQHDPNDDNHGTVGNKTTIEDHVWLAPHCIILPGVKVSRGCVIATNAVVTKNTIEKSLYAGLPAIKIKDRNNSLQYSLRFKTVF